MAPCDPFAREPQGPRVGPGNGQDTRELCLSLGVDVLQSDEGMDKISEVLQKNSAPNASDAAF